MTNTPEAGNRTKKTMAFLIVTSIACVCVIWSFPYFHSVGLQTPEDSFVADALSTAWVLFMLVYCVVVLSLAFGVAGLFNKNTRKLAVVSLVAFAVFIVSSMGSVKKFHDVRTQIFTDMAHRSQPLVSAIKAYHEDKSAPPESLNALVPDYLPAVPSTGVAAHPEYRYSNKSWTEPNEWELSVSTLNGLNFDQMLYLPHENYPVQGYGGSLERIGNWAYVHE